MSALASVTISDVGPIARESERYLIGCCLLASLEDIVFLAGVVEPADFEDADLAKIWECVTRRAKAGQPVNEPLLVHADLYRETGSETSRTGLPWAHTYMVCEQWVISCQNAHLYARLVRDLSLQRRALKLSREIEHAAKDPESDPEAVGRMLTEAAAVIELRRAEGQATEAEDAAREAYNEAIDRAGESSVGIPLGLHGIDELTNGWQIGELILLAGRPGEGKTSLIMQAVLQAIHLGKQVFVVTLEMPIEHLMQRLYAQDTRHSSSRIARGKATGEELSAYLKWLETARGWPIHFLHKDAFDIHVVAGEARKIQQQHGELGMVAIDYVQLMRLKDRPRNMNREGEVSEISRTAKEIALSLRVPVLAACQLNRAVEQRGTRKTPGIPILSDLRESGSLEQDADVVLFVHRKDKPTKENRGIVAAQLILAKQRRGPTGIADVMFHSGITRFEEKAREDAQDPARYGQGPDREPS